MTDTDSPPELVAAQAWKLLVRSAGPGLQGMPAAGDPASQRDGDAVADAAHSPSASFWEASWSGK